MSIDPVIIIITLTSTLGPIIIALNKSIKSCNCFFCKCEKFDLQRDLQHDEDENKNENKKSFFNKIIDRISPRRKKKEMQSENLNERNENDDYCKNELNELNRLKDKVNELKENKNDKVYDLE